MADEKPIDLGVLNADLSEAVWKRVTKFADAPDPATFRERYMKVVLEELDKIRTTTDAEIELEPIPPEEEAALRLKGTFDPNAIRLKVRPAKPLEFVNIEFTVGGQRGRE